MRIALFSECYSPVTNGVVTSIHTLRETLRAWGHTVFLFAPGTSQPDDDGDVFRLPELPFPKHPYHFARPFPRLHFDFAALDCDIVNCQHPFTVGRLGADLARKYRLPMVYTAHTLYDTMAATSKSPIVRTMGQPAARGVIRRFCARADYVIAPTRHTRDELRGDGVRARFAIVPSGVLPPSARQEARGEVRHNLNVSEGTPLLLYVGRLGPEKRVDLLLHSVSRLKRLALDTPLSDFRLAIVGDGECRNNLESLAQELNVTDRVIFCGGQPHNTIGDWLAAGDIFVMPSPVETQGLGVVEAMASGLPCVAVDAGGVREVVVNAQTGLRVPFSSTAFADAVAMLMRSPEQCARFGQNARERAARYSPDAMASNVLSVYDNALSLPRHTKSESGRPRTLRVGIRRKRAKRL